MLEQKISNKIKGLGEVCSRLCAAVFIFWNVETGRGLAYVVDLIRYR